MFKFHKCINCEKQKKEYEKYQKERTEFYFNDINNQYKSLEIEKKDFEQYKAREILKYLEKHNFLR